MSKDKTFCSTSEKAKQWKISKKRVREFCFQGVIPTAERFPLLRWRIPRYNIKPPMSRHGLCYLLDYVDQVRSGAVVDFSKCGYPEPIIREGYNYLISYGFITSFNYENIEEELPNCHVTQRGKDLMQREKDEQTFRGQMKAKSKFNNNNNIVGNIFKKAFTNKAANTINEVASNIAKSIKK